MSGAIVTDLSSLAFPNCLQTTLSFPEMVMFPQKLNERAPEIFLCASLFCLLYIIGDLHYMECFLLVNYTS